MQVVHDLGVRRVCDHVCDKEHGVVDCWLLGRRLGIVTEESIVNDSPMGLRFFLVSNIERFVRES